MFKMEKMTEKQISEKVKQGFIRIKMLHELAGWPAEHVEKTNTLLTFLPLGDKTWKEKIQKSSPSTLLYITEAHVLKKTDRETLLETLKSYDFILCSTSNIESDFNTIALNTDSKLYDQNEILTIDDYVKFIVNSFQYKFPDTELSKKLGISRKSLWEKRKKYGLFKKK